MALLISTYVCFLSKWQEGKRGWSLQMEVLNELVVKGLNMTSPYTPQAITQSSGIVGWIGFPYNLYVEVLKTLVFQNLTFMERVRLTWGLFPFGLFFIWGQELDSLYDFKVPSTLTDVQLAFNNICWINVKWIRDYVSMRNLGGNVSK